MTPVEKAAVQIHEYLYPEQHGQADEPVQWDAETIEVVAGMLCRVLFKAGLVEPHDY